MDSTNQDIQGQNNNRFILKNSKSFKLKRAFVVLFGFAIVFAGKASGVESGRGLLNVIGSHVEPFGYRLQKSKVVKDYFVHPEARQIFARFITPTFDLRDEMPDQLPKTFDPLVDRIEAYISEYKRRGVKVPSRIIAEKIVRVCFCAGTDPFLVAAVIHKESNFHSKAVSPTGAVGLSQLTASAIEEVHDQLGNRGAKHSSLETQDYFRAIWECAKKGNSYDPPWTVGVIKKGQRVMNSKSRSRKVKSWIIKSSTRDLLYGQILLKSLLSITDKGSQSPIKHYRKALVRYNGDNGIVRGGRFGGQRTKNAYASQVLEYYKGL